MTAPSFSDATPFASSTAQVSDQRPKADVGRRLMAAGIDEGLVTLVLGIVSVGALGTVYFIAQDCVGGQSLGRRAVGQFLVDYETGRIVEPVKAAIRNLVAFLFALTTIGLLVDLLLMILRPDGRRVADLLIGTQVVEADQVVTQMPDGPAPAEPAAEPAVETF